MTLPDRRSLPFTVALSFFCLMVPIFSAEAQTAAGSLSGEVRDAVTQQPLPGANVMLAGTAKGTICDEKGYFVIRNIEPGAYRVKAAMIGYESSSNPDVVVVPQRNKKISFNLKASAVEMNEVAIQSDYFSKPSENIVSMRTLSPEEIRRSPERKSDAA